MANLRYFVLDAADVPQAVIDCEPRHFEESGGCELSVTWNVPLTAAIIKCQGASKDWRRDKAWIADSDVYDRDNRYGIFDWFYSPEWQKENDLAFPPRYGQPHV